MASELEAHSMGVEFKTRAVILDLLKLKEQAQSKLDSDSPLEVEAMKSLIDVINDSIAQFRFSGMSFTDIEGEEDKTAKET